MSVVIPVAVTSLDPSTWKEPSGLFAELNGIRHQLKADDKEGNAVILRRYYPLRARLKTFDNVLGFQKGVILKFARVKHVPDRFPIEVFFAGPTGRGDTRMARISYDSSEIELLPA
jgi:hypothetical protein